MRIKMRIDVRVNLRIKQNLVAQIKSKVAGFNRRVGELTDKADGDVLRADVGDGKSDRIPLPAQRQARTGSRISEIAKISHLVF